MRRVEGRCEESGGKVREWREGVRRVEGRCDKSTGKG